MNWEDLTIKEISEFVTEMDQVTNFKLLGWSFLFQYERWEDDIFPGGNSVVQSYRRMVTFIIQLYNNNGYRVRRVNGVNNTDKIQIFR